MIFRVFVGIRLPDLLKLLTKVLLMRLKMILHLIQLVRELKVDVEHVVVLRLLINGVRSEGLFVVTWWMKRLLRLRFPCLVVLALRRILNKDLYYLMRMCGRLLRRVCLVVRVVLKRLELIRRLTRRRMLRVRRLMLMVRVIRSGRPLRW